MYEWTAKSGRKKIKTKNKTIHKGIDNMHE